MGKKILVVIFILVTMTSVYTFFSRERTSLREQVPEAEKNPRIVLKDFTMYRYQGARVEATVSGQNAFFFEPNILEMYGNLNGVRTSQEKGKREFVRAQASVTLFESRGIVQMTQSSDIEKSSLENDVAVGFDEKTIFTQHAEYTSKPQRLYSDLPVELRSRDGNLKSETGFEYLVEEKLLQLHGPIRGKLQNGAKINP